MPRTQTDWNPMAAGAQKWRWIDFANELGPGEALTSTPAGPTATASIFSGADASPQSRILEGPNISGTSVGVLIGNGPLSGTVYQVTIGVYTTLGEYLVDWALQSITAA
jgi:hypothetical protein